MIIIYFMKNEDNTYKLCCTLCSRIIVKGRIGHILYLEKVKINVKSKQEKLTDCASMHEHGMLLQKQKLICLNHVHARLTHGSKNQSYRLASNCLDS